MITLSTERGLVTIESWEDIESLAGFKIDLNPKNHTLKEIIGNYSFPEKIRCGLSNCHTQHNKGYIALTKDGLTTNIGKDCGKRIFGTDFDVQSRKFDRQVSESKNRETLFSFSLKIDSLNQRLSLIREGERGADWVHKKLTAISVPSNDFPRKIVSAIQKAKKDRTQVIKNEREATNFEVKLLEERKGHPIKKPHYIEDEIAKIEGIESLYDENNLRKLLIENLQTYINKFKNLAIDDLNHRDLLFWCKWIATVEKTIETAERAKRLGNLLLTKSNLQPLEKLLDSYSEKEKFREFLKTL